MRKTMCTVLICTLFLGAASAAFAASPAPAPAAAAQTAITGTVEAGAKAGSAVINTGTEKIAVAADAKGAELAKNVGKKVSATGTLNKDAAGAKTLTVASFQLAK